LLRIASIERSISLILISCNDFEQLVFDLQHRLWGDSWSADASKLTIEHLESINSRLTDFFCAVCLLHCVSMIERDLSSADVIADIVIATTSKVSRACGFDVHSATLRSSLIEFRSKPNQTNELSRLLIDSSEEYLAVFMQVMSRDYGLVRTIVNDFEAMFAYKRGLYSQCLYFSCANLNQLLTIERNEVLYALRAKGSDLFLLLDDDCVSLIGLARLCGVFDQNSSELISQLTLSLYFYVQSKLRQKHSIESWISDLYVIERVHNEYAKHLVINRAILSCIYRKVIKVMRSS